MSNQADTRALRALMDEHAALTLSLRAAAQDDNSQGRAAARQRLREVEAALVNAAPALLDEVDALRAEVREQSAIMADWRSDRDDEVTYGPAERDALRARVAELEDAQEASREWALERSLAESSIETLTARVAELEREVERVRAYKDLAEALDSVCTSYCAHTPQSEAAFAKMKDARAALAPRAEVKP